MKVLTNNELYALSGILAGMTVSGPTIPAAVTAKLIDAVCQVQEEAEKLRRTVETIRAKTRPEGVKQTEQVTDEQRSAWDKAFTEQMEILGNKSAPVKFELLTPEEFRQVVGASTLTGSAAALLYQALGEK